MTVSCDDNSIVTVASNNGTEQPLASASVPRPKVISGYNQHMGGAELHGKGIANYQQWWWLLYISLIDKVNVNFRKIMKSGRSCNFDPH